jgi:hypothetical protein
MSAKTIQDWFVIDGLEVAGAQGNRTAAECADALRATKTHEEFEDARVKLLELFDSD